MKQLVYANSGKPVQVQDKLDLWDTTVTVAFIFPAEQNMVSLSYCTSSSGPHTIQRSPIDIGAEWRELVAAHPDQPPAIVCALQDCARWMLANHQSHRPEVAAACRELAAAGYGLYRPGQPLPALPATDAPTAGDTPTMLVSIDGGIAYMKVAEVRITYADPDTGALEVDQSEREDLHLTFTTEGMVIDVVGQLSGDVKATTAMDVEDIQELAED